MEGDPRPALAGALLANRYRVMRPIARGGAGAVYEAQDELLARRVAVKLLEPGPRGSSRDVERLRREARAAVALRHPNAVEVHDLVVDEGDRTFLVMELLAGRTVREVVAEEGPMSSETAAMIGDQLLDALASAHSLGLIHRDVKPDNIMVLAPLRDGDAPRVKVLDFGAVKVASPAEALPKLTATNVVLGTWQYVAPEQVRGEPIDGRADVYATGATLFFALTALRPHQAADAERVTFAMSNDPTPPVCRVRPDVDEELAAIVDRALAKDRAERWSSAAAMRVALRAWLARRRPTSRAIAVVGAREPRENSDSDVVASFGVSRLETLLDRTEASSSMETQQIDVPEEEVRTVNMRASSRAVAVAPRQQTLVLDAGAVNDVRGAAAPPTLAAFTPPAAFAPVAPPPPLPAALPTYRGSPRPAPVSRAQYVASRAVLVLGGAVLFVLGLLGGGFVFR